MLSIYYKTFVLCKCLFFVETQFSMKKVSISSHLGAEGKFWNLIFKVLIFENTLKKKMKHG